MCRTDTEEKPTEERSESESESERVRVREREREREQVLASWRILHMFLYIRHCSNVAVHMEFKAMLILPSRCIFRAGGYF